MSLALALNNALSGLNVNQRALSVLSQNISNANTPGYSRQVVDLAARYVDGIGQGAQVVDISRKIDEYLRRASRTQSSDVGEASTIDDYFERAQILFGQPGNTNSIDEYVQNFFNAMQSLAETPELSSLRANAVNAGASLAREVGNLARGIEDLRYQADQDIKEAATAVNNELVNLHTINLAIARAKALGSSTAGLLDQRDQSLQTIASYMDTTINYRETGEVDVYTVGGVALLDTNLYRLEFTPVNSIDTLIDNQPTGQLRVQRLDIDNVTPIGNPSVLIQSGVEESVTTVLRSGKIKGLQEIRDDLFPDILNQLDTLASTLRDQFNTLHNSGSGYPGAYVLNGTRQVQASNRTDWTGSVRLAVLNQDGTPTASGYSDETSGMRPLTLDLSQIDSGSGVGQPSVQAIIDEINWHFGAPRNRATLGNINNIELVSNSASLPGAPAQFNFDFELENISGVDGNFFVTDVQVFDDTAANITTTTSTVPSFTVANYVTTGTLNTVTVNTVGLHGFSNGDRVYITPPAGAIDGIPAAEFNQFFTITNVTATSFDIQTTTAAAVGGTFASAETVIPKYSTIEAGEKARTRADGTTTASLAGNPASTFYTFQVSVAVDNEDLGYPETAVLTFRVNNNETNLRNDRYSASSVSGLANLILPSTTQAYARATLVDADGNEIPRINGAYNDEPGYLRITAGNEDYVIAMTDINSSENGRLGDTPPQVGSGRTFSHYFELNNFFKSNLPIGTGDTITNSAINMAVEERLLDDSNLISTGRLVRSNQPADPDATPIWTYVRDSGDNSLAQELAGLGVSNIAFTAAGGLPSSNITFSGYAGALLGYNASQADAASVRIKDSQILLEGFIARSDAISGVNLDEELANTIIYQNAYAASARVITVTDELFDTLLNAFQ